ncbi:MAG: hypothetical protein WCT31_03885 [Candidatus Micrarchaeia archaeon]|jgi:hypothetical protein
MLAQKRFGRAARPILGAAAVFAAVASIGTVSLNREKLPSLPEVVVFSECSTPSGNLDIKRINEQAILLKLPDGCRKVRCLSEVPDATSESQAHGCFTVRADTDLNNIPAINSTVKSSNIWQKNYYDLAKKRILELATAFGILIGLFLSARERMRAVREDDAKLSRVAREAFEQVVKGFGARQDKPPGPSEGSS